MEDPNENLDSSDVNKGVESPLGIEMKLSKSNYPSSVHSEVSDEARELDALLNEDDIKLINAGGTSIDGQEPVEESMETMLEALQKVESLIGMDIETSNIDSSILPVENQEQLEEAIYTEETPDTMISSMQMEIELSENKDVPSIQPELQDLLKEHNTDNEQTQLQEELEDLYDSQEEAESPVKIEIKVSDNEDDLATLADLPEESKEVIKTDVMLGLSPEVPKSVKSPNEMYVELTEAETETSLGFDENTKDLEEKLEVSEGSKQSVTAEVEVELSKYEDESVIVSKDLDEIKDTDTETILDNQEPLDIDLSTIKSLDISSEVKVEVTELERIPLSIQESVEEPVQSVQEILKIPVDVVQEKVEESVEVTKEILKTSEMLFIATEKQETTDPSNSLLESPKEIESVVEPNTEGLKDEGISTTGIEQTIVAEQKDNEQSQPINELKSFHDSPKETNLSSEMEIEPLKTDVELDVSSDFHEQTKEQNKLEEKLESPPEFSKTTETSVEMEIKQTEAKEGDSIVLTEKSEDPEKNVKTFNPPEQTNSAIEVEMKLSKTDDISALQPDIENEPENVKEEDEINTIQDAQKLLEESEKTPIDEQEPVDESMETMLEALQKVESLIDMDMETSTIDDASIPSIETQEQSEETLYTEEIHKAVVSPTEMEIELSESRDITSIQPELQDLLEEHNRNSKQAELRAELEGLYDSQGTTESPVNMEIKVSDTEEDSVTSRDMPEENIEAIKSDVTLELMSEVQSSAKSPTDIYSELTKMEIETPLVLDEKTEDLNKKLQVPEVSMMPESPAEMKVELSQHNNESVTQPEDLNKIEDKQDEEEKLDNQEIVHTNLNEDKSLETPLEMKVELVESEETLATVQEPIEESTEITQLSLEIPVTVQTPVEESIEATQDILKTPIIIQEPVEKSMEATQEIVKASVDVQESIEESMEITQEILKTSENIQEPVEESMEITQDKQEESEKNDFPLEESEKIKSPTESTIHDSTNEDISTVQLKKQVTVEEQDDNVESQLKEKLESSCVSPERTDSPSETEIESLNIEDKSVLSLDPHTGDKNIDEIEEKLKLPSESSNRIESPVEMQTELTEAKEEAFMTPMEKSDLQENLELFNACKELSLSVETDIKLSSADDTPISKPVIQDEPENEKQKEDIVTQDTHNLLKESEIEMDSNQMSVDVQSSVEESVETMLEALQKVESLISTDMETSSIGDSSALPTKQEPLEDSEPVLRTPNVEVSSFETGTELLENTATCLIQSEEQDLFRQQVELQEVLDTSFNSLNPLEKMKVEASNNEEDLTTSKEPKNLPEQTKEVSNMENTLELPPEIAKNINSPIKMDIELTKTEAEISTMSNENLKNLEKQLEVVTDAKLSESSKEMDIELSKCDKIQSEHLDETKNTSSEKELNSQGPHDINLNTDKLLNISPTMKVEVTESREALASMQESVEESMEITQESLKETEPSINIKIKLSEIGTRSVEMQEETDETKSVPKEPESLIEPKVKVSKSEDTSMAQAERQIVAEEQKDNTQSKEKLGSSCDTPKRTNSPLGMKIKLFKTGDASIIPLDFHEEPKEAGRMKDKLESSSESPKRTESPIGMKIKLAKTKSGASIIPIEKSEDVKENLEAADVAKRTDSPLGMRIKLSKTGDASIIQSEIQDENKHTKHKEKVDSVQDAVKVSETSSGMKLRLINTEETTVLKEEQMEEMQEVLPKVESPIGMKIRLSKSGDAAIIPPEKQEHTEEAKRIESPLETKIKTAMQVEGQSTSEEHNRDNVYIEPKDKLETCYGSPKRTNSPIGMKIKLFKSGDASIVPCSLSEESKESSKMKDRLCMSSEVPKRTDSPIGMKIKLAKTKGGASIIPMETLEDPKESLEVPDVSKRTESPLGMKIKLFKSGDASIVHSEISEEVKDTKQKEKLENKGKIDLVHEALSGIKMKGTKVEALAASQESPEESMEPVPESWQKVESSIGMKIKLSKFGDASIIPVDKQEHHEETKSIQEIPKRTESPLGMKIRLSKTGDASIIQPEWLDHLEEHNKDHAQSKPKDKLDASYDSPKRTGSPLGMKIKLSKTGDASIVSSDLPEESKAMTKLKDKLESSPEVPKRTESPISMKIKLAKTKSGAAIISMDNTDDSKEKLEVPDIPKRTESPLGMKIKLFKSGDASIVHSEIAEEVKDAKQKEKTENWEKVDVSQDAGKSSETSGMKIKVIKSGETPIIMQEPVDESVETTSESWQKVESPIGMKIKLSKFGDASIIPAEKEEQPEEGKSTQEVPRRTESPLGRKIKFSKTGDASIVPSEAIEDGSKLIRTNDTEHSKPVDTALGMKIKLLKTGDASIVDSEKKERQQRRQDTETPLEMKIKLSKTGHATIVAYDNQGEAMYKQKEITDSLQSHSQRYKESVQGVHKDSALKIFKTGHSSILQGNRSELTIEPVQAQGKKLDNMLEISPKRKDISIAPIESKKPKLDAQITQILPEVTIQPVASRDQKQYVFEQKNKSMNLSQMNVLNQEISITQVKSLKPADTSMSEKLKDMLSKNVSGSPMNSDCEIIEQRPELIIVNENSNSSQDVVIIEEVSLSRPPEVKIPKKRGRPRRNPLPQGTTHPPPQLLVPRDPLSLDDMKQMQQPQVPRIESRENERPKRTCRSQKSYAPPKRGRGRGRGKRKLDGADSQMSKKAKIEQDLTMIEASTTAVITIDDSMTQSESFGKSPELYKALKQPTLDSKIMNLSKEKKTMGSKSDGIKNIHALSNTISEQTIRSPGMNKETEVQLKTISKSNASTDNLKDEKLTEIVSDKMDPRSNENKSDKPSESTKLENKDMLIPPGDPNWLTPASKRSSETVTKSENVSTVQVIDEETRMSAESGSRSQTPARNIPAQASETIINEESQGSVLSTATTESEKVKVKNRRMEINFDPDEGPFTVDKIAEYEWPLDRKGETFMIQEQISQYLGVKSFKRKYPDLKRRVVDMEERNYLRENGLVSEAMCDMGLTAICSSEVLDVMCSDFPDQYEEYRKHMREKQVKEHSKKQKELTAAANAEKTRIDLAEMAVQSALSWNISLNKARREDRKCSLDLQTFTIHVPRKQQKVEERKVGYYPVALIPGQYTDYYREYTPAELRYYPLNTVLYGPTRPNERKFDSQSEGSQSDNDSDSSSDDSSSSSSEGTQNTEGSQSTMDDVDMEIANQKEEVKLKCKMCLKTLNKHGKVEVLIQCGTCNGHVHPSCIDLTLDMVPHIQSYAWQCTDCKTCAQCHDPADEDKMLFCDMCDRGYHIYCVGLRRVPQGRWHCQECAVCANCASKEPGGINSDRNSVAQWQHEYKKGDKNTRVYVSTLCVPCSKLWRKGRYCPHCSRCHTAPRLDLEANLVHCSACDKYLHLDCVETKGVALDRKNYLCDFCAPTRQHMVKPLMSKTLKT
ncbi:PHD finger protein enhancer of yellow 3 isoform X1 [Megachile rotundata]|uniref:PHD finger protein enhancer of yellow 3 isoform X1 n=1 Tax=Megachile rotundata TaxID=143995 RepID=UPI003FD43986